jgi:hypothetical protein
VKQVAWIRSGGASAILAVNNHVITRNNRITVQHDGHYTWYLKIADVQESDGGVYLCQINTERPMTRSSHLSVVVPPDIVDAESSSDVIVREKGDVQLKCKAKGSPKVSCFFLLRYIAQAITHPPKTTYHHVFANYFSKRFEAILMAVPPDHLLLNSVTNFGPLISRWEINRFKNC